MPVARQSVKKKALGIELILCPRQPGKLWISKEACALRYLKAQGIRRKRSARSIGMVQRSGLEICRTCPDGRRYAVETSGSTSSKGHARR
jgi:hypothetical protein